MHQPLLTEVPSFITELYLHLGKDTHLKSRVQVYNRFCFLGDVIDCYCAPAPASICVRKDELTEGGPSCFHESYYIMGETTLPGNFGDVY